MARCQGRGRGAENDEARRFDSRGWYSPVTLASRPRSKATRPAEPLRGILQPERGLPASPALLFTALRRGTDVDSIERSGD